MFTLINIKEIINKHYESLKQDSKCRFIILIFFLMPIGISGMLLICDKPLSENSVDSLITAFAIFTALLLNVIFIIYDLIDKIGVKESSDVIKSKVVLKRKIKLIEHLSYNSVYSLLISLVILMILMLFAVVEIWNIKALSITSKHSIDFLLWGSLLVYSLVVHFLMNLLMITKRLSVLFDKTIARVKEDAENYGKDKFMPEAE